MKSIEFFFDLSSPYSYLAATQLPAIAERTGARIEWKPFVLFAVFKATGNEMPARVANKASYMLADLARWVAHYKVDFKMSSRFPQNTISAERLVLAGEEQGRAAETAMRCFRGMWVDDLDMNDPAVLRRLAEESGLDADKAMAAIESPAIKNRLRENTDRAIAKGAFGAPAIFVGDEHFWGNDRLHFVEDALNKA